MQRVSRRAGRALTTIVCRSASVLLLCVITGLAMAEGGFDLEAGPLGEYATLRYVLPPLYVLRTWLMNCTSGLTKSILNDYISKAHRAKWNALESVNLFSWSGSSMIGGYVINAYGFHAAFLITAALQACSIACLTPLLCLVALEAPRPADRHHPDAVAAATRTSRASYADRLLPTEVLRSTEEPDLGGDACSSRERSYQPAQPAQVPKAITRACSPPGRIRTASAAEGAPSRAAGAPWSVSSAEPSARLSGSASGDHSSRVPSCGERQLVASVQSSQSRPALVTLSL